MLRRLAFLLNRGLLGLASAAQRRQRKRAAQEDLAADLTDTELLASRLLGHISELAVLLDAEGFLLFANTPFERAVNQAEEALAGRRFLEFVHPDDRLAASQCILFAFSDSQIACPRACHQRMPLIQGWRHFNFHYTPLPRGDGGTAGVIGIGREVESSDWFGPERRQAESILATVADPVSLVDRQYIFRYVNKFYERLFARPRAAIVGRSVADLLGDRVFLSNVKPHLDHCFDGVTVSDDSWFELQPGSHHFMSMTYRPYRDADGQIVGAAVTGRDNSALARARAQAEMVLGKYRVMFDHFPLGIMVTDAQGRITEVNSVASRLLGGAFGHYIGRRIDVDDWNLVDAEGRALPVALSPTTRAFFENRVMADEIVGAQRPDGSVVWFNVTAAPLPLANQGVVVAFEDVTERRLAEAARQELVAMRQSERRFRLMADGVPLMLWGSDGNGELEFANAGFRQFFGLASEPPDRPSPTWSELLHRDDLELFHNGLQHSLVRQTLLDIQCRARRSDGEWRWIQVSAQPHRALDGEVLGLVGAMQDISARRRTEAELHKSRNRLRGRAERLARLTLELTLAEQRERQRIGGLLHDHLQQDLVAAKFQLENLLKTRDLVGNEMLKHASGLMHQAIETARNLNADLHPLPLYQGSFGAAMEWLARKTQDRHGLQVELRVDQDAKLDGEEQRILLFESVRELLLNVVKHAGVKHATLQLGIDEGSVLVVRVQDGGSGFQEDSMRPGDLGPGFGLLAIRERIVLLNGALTIASGPGLKGTRVCMRVPLANATRHRLAEQPAALAPLAGNHRATVGSSLLRILLADDHVMVRQALANLLDGEPDFQVVAEASDGFEAIEMVQCLQPNVVLMDFEMPDCDGPAASRVICQRWPGVRVIGLSMHEEEIRVAEMLDAGAEAVISKADVIEVLLEQLRTEALAFSE